MRGGRRRFRGLLMLASCVLGLVLALPGCGVGTTDTLDADVPASSRPVDASAPARPAAGDHGASPPLRIIYPAAGMDIPVHTLDPDENAMASRSLVPPETMDGYWLASFGSPGAGSTNTTYVIGHSWVGRDAPFNRLSTAAAPGDRLTVDTAAGALGYQVVSVATYTKSTLKDSAIWTIVPNSLVLISCYTEDPWGKNVVVVASPAPGGP